MSMSSPALTPSAITAPVLADIVPGARVRDAALVAAGTGFVAVASQIIIPLGFTPVPLSLSTFAVLLTGAALGFRRGALALGLYMLLGMIGLPFFAEGGSGWAFASFGYVVSYIPAAALVGYLAERKADRSVLTTVLMAVAGTSVIYAIGLPWLMMHLDVSLATGLELGVTPFLVGDVVKAAGAAALLPAAWKLIGRR